MLRNTDWKRTVIWVGIFAIAMGFLEGAVVVYLRKIYYPGGFRFPLVPIDTSVAMTEVGREAATLIMLLTIGILAGRSRTQRFAYFIYSFAIWDIFYYIFLKILIGWPESLLTWDVLFLIPTTWTGPVIAPIILSLTMIGLALFIIIAESDGRKVILAGLPLILLVAGSLIVILAFIRDYSSFMLEHFSFSQLFSLSASKELLEAAQQYIPEYFSWWLFLAGILTILAGIYFVYRNNRKVIQ
jgi:hypothetical protein